MRLAIDARMLRSSGIGTIIANVTPRLIARNPDWRFQIAGDAADLRRFDWAGAPNVECLDWCAPIYSIAEQLSFPAALSASTMLWSPNYNIPLRWRGRLIVNINDLAHLVLPEMRRSPAKQAFARFMFHAVRSRADAIVYISKFSLGEFHRLVGEPRGAEWVIYCGVDDEWFDIPHSMRQATPYILFVGNVKPHKNLSRLLDAFALVRDQIPHDLLIVGRKEGLITGDNDVLRRIEAFEGRVAFTGYVPDSGLKAIFAGADALVLPSLYEGFGLPPIEAMAAGCPVLVSRAASLPEVCQDAALYCDPLDVADMAAQLKRILSDQDLRQSLRQRGLDRAHALNWDSCVQGYETAIRNLLAMPTS